MLETNSVGEAVGTSYFGMIASNTSAKKQSQSVRHCKKLQAYLGPPQAASMFARRKRPPRAPGELLEGGGFVLPALSLHSSCLLPVILLLGAHYSHHPISPQVVSQEAQEPANAFMNEPIQCLLHFLPNYNETGMKGRPCDQTNPVFSYRCTKLNLPYPETQPPASWRHSRADCFVYGSIMKIRGTTREFLMH